MLTIIIEWLRLVFILLFFIAILPPFINSKDEIGIGLVENDSASKEEDKTKRFSMRLEKIEFVAIIICIIISFICLTLTVNSKLIRISTVLILLIWAQASFGNSLGIIKNIVTQKKDSNFSRREYEAIYFFAYGVIYMILINIDNYLLKIFSNIEIIIVRDMLIAFMYIIILSIYLFMICTFILLIINKIGNNKKVMSKFNKMWTIYRNGIRCIFSKTYNIDDWKYHASSYAEKNTVVKKAVKWIIIVSLVVFDIIYNLLRGMLNFIVAFVGCLLSLLYYLLSGMKYLFAAIYRLSDVKWISYSLRISVILALTIVVVINRYSSIFLSIDSSTETLEFIAGTIVIPMMFELVLSYKKEFGKKEN